MKKVREGDSAGPRERMPGSPYDLASPLCAISAIEGRIL
jgi:hypothetical protein